MTTSTTTMSTTKTTTDAGEAAGLRPAREALRRLVDLQPFRQTVAVTLPDADDHRQQQSDQAPVANRQA